MRPAREISETALRELECLLKESTSKSQLQRIQCVLLRARQGMTCNEVAAAVGWNAGWVRQVWSTYLNEGASGLVCQERGGRRRSNLLLEEERALVARFEDQARAGGMLVISDIHQAYEKQVGHAVAKSTIYRMLARHGWRKVAPRPHHPKNDPELCAAFKKNSPASLRAKGSAKRR